MIHKRIIKTSMSILLLLVLLARVAQAEAPVRDTRSWTDPSGSGLTITFSTPELYNSCTSGSDDIYTQGVPGNWYLDGYVRVYWATPDNGLELVPNGEYLIQQSGDLNLTISYPPASEWPDYDPSPGWDAREIHVDLSIVVRDESGALVTWVGGDPTGAPATLGPGQDWDVSCVNPPPPQMGPGTGTPGYWMNHPEAWPVEEITIGGETYTKADAIGYMQAPVEGDKTYTMFPALVAAKLNVMIGNDDSCIAETIAAADAWMAGHPVGSGVEASSDAWQAGESWYETLDEYNNGELCAPARD